MDVFSAEKRSWIMSRIRSSGTSPERRLTELVKANLPDFVEKRRRVRQCDDTLPGKPDVFVPCLRLVFFVDGCFFHGCPRHYRRPTSNASYWLGKIERNRCRDRRQTRVLRSNGFSVWRFWEHDLAPRKIAAAEKRIRRAMQHCVQRFDGVGATGRR